MKASQALLFDVILTLVLTAVAASQVLSFSGTDHNSQRSQITLPDQLAGFEKVTEANVPSNHDYAERLYVRGNRYVRVYVRRFDALDRIHDFRDCLLSNGFDPVERGAIEFANARGSKMEAAEISTGHEKAISLLWFKLGARTHADRWSWRKDLLLHPWAGNQRCEEIRVVTSATDHHPADIAELERLAVTVNSLSF